MESIIRFFKQNSSRISKSKFSRNIIIISSGSVISQFINMIFSPIITRLYLPEEYGVLAVFSSILVIFSFSSLMYEMAIPIAKDESTAINLVTLSSLILIIFVSCLTIALSFGGEALLSLLDAESLYPYRFLVPLGVLLIGFHKILTQWMYRIKNFSILSKTKITQNLTGNILKVGAGVFGFGVNGLLLATVIRESASIIPLTKNFFKKDKNESYKISFQSIKVTMNKFKDFPIYQTPSTFLSSFKNQLPIFSLALYGSQIVGLYGLANTIVKLPMTLLGHSVRNVFFAEAASIGKENPLKLKMLSDKLFKKMLIIGLIPLVILIVFGPHLFSIVFGYEWFESGVIARILSIAIYADFIFSPVSRIFEVLEKQKEKMFLDLGGLLLVLLSFLFSRIVSSDPMFAIVLYSLTMALIYFVTYILAQKYMKEEIKNTFIN